MNQQIQKENLMSMILTNLIQEERVQEEKIILCGSDGEINGGGVTSFGEEGACEGIRMR